MLNSISISVWPSLAEMYAKREVDGFNQRLVELTRLVDFMGITRFSSIIAYNHFFLLRWLGPGNDGGRMVVLVVSLNAVLLTLLAIYNVALVTTGKVARLAKSALLTAILNVIASVVFTKWLGLIGPVLETLGATLIIQAWYVPLLLRRVFGTSLRRLFSATRAPLVWGVSFTAVHCLVSDNHHPPGWFALLGEMLAASLLFLILGSVSVCLLPLGEGARRADEGHLRTHRITRKPLTWTLPVRPLPQERWVPTISHPKLRHDLILGVWVIFGPDDRRLWNERFVRPLLARFRR